MKHSSKLTKKIKMAFFILSFVFITNKVFGQLQVTSSSAALTATQIANYLVGAGVTVSNATITGAATSIGKFANGNTTNLGLNSGIVLSTGKISNIPANASSQASSNQATAGDAQLSALVSGETNYDASVLQFDITSISNSIELKYVFASEEYPEYVCSDFNDVFGFFISGLNPLGGNYTNYNIALIPGTTQPVAINSINSGTAGPNACTQIWPWDPPCPPCILTNSVNYINNTGSTIIFDGFTKPLIASCKVIPYQTYHVKIAIGDVVDQVYDSGVFLLDGSLYSSNSSILIYSISTPALGDSLLTFQFNSQIICSSVQPANFRITGNDGTHNVNTISYTQGNQYDSTFTITFYPPLSQTGTYILHFDSLTNPVIDINGDTVNTTSKEFIITGIILTTNVISNINTNTATCGGNIINDGGNLISARGVCWSTNVIPTLYNFHSISGNGIGTFTSNITGLIAGTTYYVRAYATNSIGTTYGNQYSFTTMASIPTLSTTPITWITINSSSSGGTIISDGGSLISNRGVCWSTNTNPAVSDFHTADGNGIGTFMSSLTGLTASTIYYIRAYATNSVGTAYGDQLSFTTLAIVNSFNGNIKYNNSQHTSLISINLNLLQNGSAIATSTSDNNGNFSFSNISNGNYSVIFATSKPWGGVSATDALKIKRHIAGLELLTEPIRLSAADVNNSGNITATDALKVQRRLVGIDNTFTSSDWIFEKQIIGGDSIIINNANVTQNFYGICTGDVNGSHIPTILKNLSSVFLENNSIITVSENEVFNIPVRIAKGLEIGALQLILAYPSEYIEIQNVSLPFQNEELLFNIEKGELKIVWTSLVPLTFTDNDIVFSIKCKALKPCENLLGFELKNENELADAIGNVHQLINLNTYSINIKNTSTLIDKNILNKSINIYPNPVTNFVYIESEKYLINDLEIRILDVFGKRINIDIKAESNKKIKLNFSKQQSGIYFLEISFGSFNTIQKISIQK